MSQFIENLQYKLKTSSSSLLLSILKISVGLIVGLTFALIGQQILNYQNLAFFFVIITTALAFQRVARGWSFANTLVFILVCVLIGFLLQMYIQIAPGA